jgi:cyclic pyranopterin phosphate synthase
LTPIKVNAVVVRDYNDQDVVDLARLTLARPWQVRFIEMMPFAGVTEFQRMGEVGAAEIRASIVSAFGPLEVANGGRLDGEARLFRFPNGKGTIGFISTVTQPFCASCTRARLTADGRLRLCLLREREVDLLAPMRSGATDMELRQIILDAVWQKPWGHQLAQGAIPLNRAMSEIGG